MQPARQRLILRTSRGVTLVGAAGVARDVLDRALALAPVVVAADGGAESVLARGLLPDAVIGDLDSLPAAAAARIPSGRLHRIDDQETTDFDKCLRAIRAPLVLATGFTGRRLDHELAAFATLLAHARRPCLLLGPEDVVFVAPREVELALAPGTRVSLFPMGPLTGRSEGLRWPIDGIRFAPSRRIGTSNEAVAPRVRLSFSARRMLVILPSACLEAAIRTLAPRFPVTAAARGG